jgi:hypothetical protein
LADSGNSARASADWEVPDTESKAAQESLEREWGRSKRLLRHARRSLRLHVSCLRESVYGPSEQGYEEDYEHLRFATSRIDDWRWIVRSSEEEGNYAPMLEKHLSKFKYSLNSHDNGAGEIIIELGDMVINNRLADERHQLVVGRYAKGGHADRAFDRNELLRFYARNAPPVAGIPVHEHVEFNVTPLIVNLSHRLVKLMESFYTFDLSAAVEKADADSRRASAPASTTRAQLSQARSGSSGSVLTQAGGMLPDQPASVPQSGRSASITVTAMYSDARAPAAPTDNNSDTVAIMAGRQLASASPDPGRRNKARRPSQLSRVRAFANQECVPEELEAAVEEMKSRAQRNHTYLYVLVPSFTVCTSYKAESSIGDFKDFVLTLPPFEYHNLASTPQVRVTGRWEKEGFALSHPLCHPRLLFAPFFTLLSSPSVCLY